MERSDMRISIGGYMGKILRVELTRSKISEQDLNEEFVKKYVGGYGTAARILYDEVPPWIGAFDPMNELVFSTGPVCGTATPTASRYVAVAKSPMTGYFGDASSGGFFPAELKFSGFDMVVFSGNANKPAYLWINDGKAELRDARPYWGMNTRQTERALRQDLGDRHIQVACIGQAGENLVRYAAIMNDDGGRAAARCGLGAVMGFKRLKAVAVRGHARVPVADAERLVKLARDVNAGYGTSSNSQNFTKRGTPGSFQANWEIGDTPAYNWSDEFGGFDSEKIASPGGYDEVLKGKRSCYNCALACRRIVEVQNERRELENGAEGPEYETLAAMGSNCGVADIRIIAKANDLCNIYGVDTISAGCAVAFAMECSERGILSAEDTDGVNLKFGNGDALVEFIEKIVFRKGFGNILAEGVRRASRIIGRGSDYYAIETKGLEIAMHDPRAFQGGGPHYACAVTGGRHTEGITLTWETGGTLPHLGYMKSIDRFSTENKGRLAKLVQDWRAAINIMGWCLFALFQWDKPELFPAFYTAVTGLPMDFKEMMKTGERVFNLKKAFNVRHGSTRSEDRLPQRLLREANKRAGGAVVQLNEMLPEYYEARGWDPIRSIPTSATLTELGLHDVAEDLWPASSNVKDSTSYRSANAHD
jgi:aldehyde:ferredoxin oxidoreductase